VYIAMYCGEAAGLVGPIDLTFGNEITAIRYGKWSNQFSGFGFESSSTFAVPQKGRGRSPPR